MGQTVRVPAFDAFDAFDLDRDTRRGERLPSARLLVTGVAAWLCVCGAEGLTRASGHEPAVAFVTALLAVIVMQAPAKSRLSYTLAGLTGILVANAMFGGVSPTAIGLALCSLLEVGVVAFLGAKLRPGAAATRKADGGYLLLIAAVAPLPSVSLASAILARSVPGYFVALWASRYASEVLGLIVLLPFALLVRPGELRAIFGPRKLVPTALLFAILLAIEMAVFGQQSLPVLFIILPTLVCVAFRLGVAGTAIAVLLTACIGTILTVFEHGPLMLGAELSSPGRAFVLQLFIAVAAGSTLPVAMALRDRDRLQQQLLERFSALSESHGDLSKHVAQIEGLIALKERITAALPSRPAVIGVILRYAAAQTGATGAVMERVAGDDLVYEVATGPFAAAVGTHVRRDASLSGTCSMTNEVLRCDDAFKDKRVDGAACRRLKIRSMIVVPIGEDGVVTAVLKVASDRRDAFGALDVLHLELIASHLSSAMRTAGEFDRSERAVAEAQTTIDHLTEAVVVFGPSLEVLRYNAAATRILLIDEGQLPRWVSRGPLFDVGGRELAPEECPVERAFETGQVQRDVIVGSGTHGVDRRWVSVTVSPIYRGDTVPERFILSARDVTLLQQSDLDQRDYVSQLRSLHLIARQVTSNRKEQIDAALVLCREELGLDWAYMGTLDSESSELVIESSLGGDMAGPAVLGARLTLSRTLVGRVMNSKEVLAVSDLATALMAEPDIVINGVWGAYIAVPISVSDRAYGAIGFTSRSVRPNGFSASERDFVRITGELIGSAIERSLQRERLDALAYFDALTGLPNRVVFQDRLVQTLLAAKRYEEKFAIFFLDLDGFKAVNDGYGHGAGDEVLKIVGLRLEKLMRDSDTVARIGGDEFIILAPKIRELTDATDLARRVVGALQMPIEVNGREHVVTVSVGVSLFPDDGLDAETLVKRADEALYVAKSSGKNSVAFAGAKAMPQALVATAS